MTDIENFLIIQHVHMFQQKRRRKYKEGYYDAIKEVYNFVKQMEENMSKEMTAVEYLKTKAKMTKATPNNACRIGCNQCRLYQGNRSHKELTCDSFEVLYPEEAVAIVQKWADEHPIKTRQSEFLKLYPNAAMNDGAIKICPLDLNVNFNCRATSERISCNTCRKDYWLKEVK